jgi:hypothetical protein
MPPLGWREITIEYNGKIINGSYKITGKTITVKSAYGTKEAPLGAVIALYLAKILLRELARQGRA